MPEPKHNEKRLLWGVQETMRDSRAAKRVKKGEQEGEISGEKPPTQAVIFAPERLQPIFEGERNLLRGKVATTQFFSLFFPFYIVRKRACMSEHSIQNIFAFITSPFNTEQNSAFYLARFMNRIHLLQF